MPCWPRSAVITASEQPAELPDPVRDRIERGGRRVLSVSTLTGGMISVAARVDTSDGPLFVKWSDDASNAPIYRAEADGLAAMRATGAVRVPATLLPSNEDAADLPFLALEYIPPTSPRDPVAFRDRFAVALADMHRVRPRDGVPGHGFPSDNFIGILPQPNHPRTEGWAAFYRECRLLPQITIARRRGRLTPECEWLLGRVLERLQDLLAGISEEPSLLHGDLWSGNYLCADGREPVLIDPATYFGVREMEIAFIELFGGFPTGFVAAYDAAYPLDEGYRRRRTLHQLYPLLVHLNHFGEPYGPAVERACREYVR
jgi:protein-ribulosamine 3-kinase